MSETKTHSAAAEWLLRNGLSLNRDKAIEACTAHLIDSLEVSESTASQAALQALADIECAGQEAWIDVDASTAYVVVIRRPNGRSIACTVKDLIRVHALGSKSHQTTH
jgi:Cu/Ag efflux pump CusA